jgi:hypothetical protein
MLGRGIQRGRIRLGDVDTCLGGSTKPSWAVCQDNPTPTPTRDTGTNQSPDL